MGAGNPRDIYYDRCDTNCIGLNVLSQIVAYVASFLLRNHKKAWNIEENTVPLHRQKRNNKDYEKNSNDRRNYLRNKSEHSSSS